MNVKLLLSLVTAFIVVVFIYQNAAVVEIKFLFWIFSMSRSLLILLLVGIGIAIGWLLKSYVDFRKIKR